MLGLGRTLVLPRQASMVTFTSNRDNYQNLYNKKHRTLATERRCKPSDCLFFFSFGGFDGVFFFAFLAAIERQRTKTKESRDEVKERESFWLMKVTVTLGLLPSQTHTRSRSPHAV